MKTSDAGSDCIRGLGFSFCLNAAEKISRENVASVYPYVVIICQVRIERSIVIYEIGTAH